MKRLIVFAATLLLLLTSCDRKEKTQEENKLNIVCTTGMIADAVKNITGHLADVEALMGPGVDPHLFKATHGDLTKLRAADIIFYNGLHLEGKMGEVFEKIEKLPGKRVIPVAEVIDKSKLILIDAAGPTYDPHIWFDVALWTEILRPVTETLKEVDSVNAETYSANATVFRESLLILDGAMREKLNEIPDNQRIIITAHDAFGYFGKAYNIEVKGLQGISTMSEAGLKDVADLVNLIVDNKIKAVFIESSVPKKAIEAVVEGCREKDHEVKIGGTLFSDAMGEAGTKEGTYIGMVEHNVNTIVNSLK